MERIKYKPSELLPSEEFGPHRGMYPVTIWWGKKYFFPSKRKALRFVAIVNQFYTQSMYEMRSLYIDIWVKWQRSTPYLTNNESGFTQADMYRKCRSAMDAVQESLELMNERSEWVNGNWIVRNKFAVIIKSFRETISIVKELYQSKNIAMELYEIDSLSRRVYAIELSIKKFGDVEARELQKPDLHEGKLTPGQIDEEINIVAA